MKLKRKHKVGLGIIISLALLLLLGSFVISKVLSKKVTDLLEKQNIEHFYFSINRTKFSLFDRSVVFTGIELRPEDSALTMLKNKNLKRNSLYNITISRLKFRGLQLTPLLFSKEIKVNKLIIDDPMIQVYSNNSESNKKLDESSFELDSIELKQIQGLQIDLIKFSNLKVQLIDIQSDKVSFANKPLDFEVSGFKLEEVSPDYFKIKPVNELLEISRIHVDFPNTKYTFSAGSLKYHFGEDHLQINGLKFKPMVNKLTLANSYTFNDEIYDLSIKEVKVFNVNALKLIQNEGVFIDSIQIYNADIEIYKDKRKPFDLKKRPQLPHQFLKNMKRPFLIEKISIFESKLGYEEKLNHGFLMRVTLDDLKSNLFNITSIQSLRKVPLKIDLSAKLMNKARLNIDMILPLKDGNNTFFFSGYMGPSKLSYYDSALIPALGLKVLDGNIESLYFQASANNYSSKGTLKMTYKDLEAKVYKADHSEKNKFLSWSVNNLLFKSNPGKNGEFREATMKFERVIYKGFGNYLWKTIQNGIVNTIAPFGMTIEKEEAKKKRKLKRQEKRQRKKQGS
ncbi:hypothetical protein LCM02_10615 [Lutimonas saemankumensis]|uniref:hypothetical protein n=1 Tax=Lutimonas saemankumensis TaxID=483016 RepID=UPI001CD1E840|nr:hypothetical protein [Lutimonas saemankumensis]MCA0932903.1 hypothetical protein [Lutimonas saemankumensis]